MIHQDLFWLFTKAVCVTIYVHLYLCVYVCFKPAGLTHTQNVITSWFFGQICGQKNGLFILLLSLFVDIKGKQRDVSKIDIWDYKEF